MSTTNSLVSGRRWRATACASVPVATAVPTQEPADVPTIRSAAARSSPWRRSPSMTPSVQAIPPTPPPPSTSARERPVEASGPGTGRFVAGAITWVDGGSAVPAARRGSDRLRDGGAAAWERRASRARQAGGDRARDRGYALEEIGRAHV